MYGDFTIKRRLLYIVLAGGTLASIFFGLVLVPRSVADSQNYYLPRTTVMQELVARTNELRDKQNLRPLIASRELEVSAKAKLVDMKTYNYWSHYSPSGTSFSSFIWEEKADSSLAGENLARCFDSYAAAFDGFTNSPAHYKVLTGDFTYIGVASEQTVSGCESIVMHVSN